MRKILIIFLLSISTCAGAAMQTITANPIPPSLGGHRTAVNTQLLKAQSNFLELYSFDSSLLASINGGSPNGSGAKIHWSQLTGVPALTGGTGADDQTALEVPFTPYGSITKTNVQEAMEQIASLSISGGIGDSASDGNIYARKDGDWTTLTGLYQPLSSNLTSLSSVVSTTSGRDILSAANYAAIRSLLGLVIGANVQAYSSGLTTWAGVTPGTGVAAFLATPSGANLATALTSALPATKGGTGLTSLGTGVATALGNAVGGAGGLQAYDADLTIVAGASSASSNTFFGKDSGGTVGFHSLTSGSYPSSNNFGWTTNGTSWTPMGLDTDIASVSASDDTIPSAKATKTALDLKANASGIEFIAAALADIKILDTAQPANGSVLINDATAYGATDDNLHLWSIEKVGGELATKITTSSTDTLTNKTYDVNGTGNVFTDDYGLPVTIISPADTDDPLIDKPKRAITLTGMDCVALGGGTIGVDLQECDANGATCATTGATIASCGATNSNDATLTDTAIAAGNWIKLVVGAPTGTVSQVSVKVYGTEAK